MSYLSASNLINATRAAAFAPRKALTVSEWADLERRLSKKGSAEPGPWRTDRNPVLREPMDCFSARSTVHDVVLMFPVQLGKALALDTPIATPAGWSRMGDLEINDTVFDENGKVCKVKFVSEVFYNHACYQITFSDGSKIVADAGHRWTVDNTRHYHRVEKVTITTQEIAGTFKHGVNNIYAIPVAGALDLPDVDLPIDPYVLGVFLGDGGSYNAQLTLNDLDAEAITSRISSAGHYCKSRKLALDVKRGSACTNVIIDPKGLETGLCHRGHDLKLTGIYRVKRRGKIKESCAECARQASKKNQYSFNVDPIIKKTFHTRLLDAGLINNKHIPQQYLRASKKQRLSLLQGILDTDGYASNQNNGIEISSSIPELAINIFELLVSLGFKPVMKTKPTKCKDSYRITFTAYEDQQPFSIPRKAERIKSRENKRVSETTRRRIVAVDPIKSVPVCCIAVDSPSHLFLAGRTMIPTHNTECAINVLGYIMDHAPGPIMVCLPGEVAQGKWINQKLNPMLEETPVVQATLTSLNSRNSSNTKGFKDFIGGQLYIEHAGSPARLKSTTVKYLIVDELTEFATNLTSGDDPLMLLEDRTSAFPSTYKRLYISTPGTKGICRTDELYQKSDQRKYHMPCPHCNEMIIFEWSGLLWDPGGINVRYVCHECGCEIQEHQKTEMIRNGRWLATNPGPAMRGYHINGLYYQIGLGPRWATLVETWLGANNDLARIKSFVNSRLAEAWEDPSMRAVKMNVIADRAEPYRLRVAPVGVAMVTAGVDTQDNRLAVHITGWGKGLASWTLDYVELMGDPADISVWVALTELLNKPIEHINGHLLPIVATAIDAGGHRTEAVKDYVRKKMIRRPMVIFGAVPNNAPVLSKPKAQDVNWGGRIDKRGVHIQHVGTVAIKNVLFGRLATDGDKDNANRLAHFSEDLPPEYFTGITSETFDPRSNRFVKKRGARNEPLDTFVYSYAATHHQELRLHRYTAAQWDDLLAKYAVVLDKEGLKAQQEALATVTVSTGISLSGWGRK